MLYPKPTLTLLVTLLPTRIFTEDNTLHKIYDTTKKKAGCSRFSHHSHPNPNPNLTLTITLRSLMWCENRPAPKA